MNILLTNDDGIHAPGLAALHEAVTDPTNSLGGPLAANLLVVAPLTVQSATSHGVTFRQPLLTHSVAVSPTLTGIAVDGRPADCVKLAVASLWPHRFGAGSRPDLVLSGINHGANVGVNVLYSGTVAAALEAAFLGVPSVALSLYLTKDAPRWDIAVRRARRALNRLLFGEANHRADPHAQRPAHLTPHACLNLNLPAARPTDPATTNDDPPIALCPMNVAGSVDAFAKNTNPLGETYYWSAGSPMDFHTTRPGSDVAELLAGKITLTPLSFDLTDRSALAAWKTRLDPTPHPRT